MRFRLLPSLLIPACLAAVGPCLAQDGARVTLQFVSFPPVKDPGKVELLVGEDKTIEVEIPSNELSVPYQVPSPGIWAVGKSSAGRDGKAVFEAYGKAKALASSRQLLLLIRKGAVDADGFRVIPIDNRGAQFGGRQFLFLNASRIEIAGEVGGEKFALAPGAHTIVKPRPDEGNNLCHATFYFRKEDTWKDFFSSNWPLQDKARGFIFFYNDPRTSRLKFHSIRDFL